MTLEEMKNKLDALEARVRQLESRPKPSICSWCNGDGTAWDDEEGVVTCHTCKGQGVTWGP